MPFALRMNERGNKKVPKNAVVDAIIMQRKDELWFQPVDTKTLAGPCKTTCIYEYFETPRVSKTSGDTMMFILLSIQGLNTPTMDFKPSVSVLFGHYSLPW